MKQLSDTFKLKENPFYGKMIEDLIKHLKTTFTIDEGLVDELFRSPFFKFSEEINTVFEIKVHKRRATITRPYQYGIVIYQLVKLYMLEFYHDFLDKHLDRHDVELIQMDTDSMNIAISGEFNKIVRPGLRSQYNQGRKSEFLSTFKYHDQTPGLFKAKFQGMRMIAVTSKCYYAEDTKSTSFAKPKISCKGKNGIQCLGLNI